MTSNQETEIPMQTQVRTPEQLVLAWLNDALAMENALAVVLRHRIKDARDFPAIEEMDRQHLEETLHHAELVKRAIARRGARPSKVKSVLGMLIGAAQAPMTGLAKDELVKNCLVDHAAEQFEVASYRALIAAANQIGDAETAEICEQIMREDQAMAERIMAGLPMVVGAHMGQQVNVSSGAAASGERRGQPAPEHQTTQQ
jgi:ferritin-like metal-binding protein YciE